MMPSDDLDDETWLREAEQAEARRKAATAGLASLDCKPGAGAGSAAKSAAAQYAALAGVNEASKGSQAREYESAAARTGQQQQQQGGGPRPAVSPTAGVYVPPGWATAPEHEDGVALPGFCGYCAAPGEQLFGLAGWTAPTDRSFENFFKTWFDEEHFPSMMKQLKAELVRRASEKGFFSGLSSQVKKWVMEKSDARLQSDVWHAYFMENSPPKYSVYGCLRTASVNLGSTAFPTNVMFFGLPEKDGDYWFTLPFVGHEGDMSAILDELDGRGGMSALLQAAA